MKNYQVLGIIGEGSYGVVLKAKHIESQQVVAIKKFKEKDDDEILRNIITREIKVLKLLQHDNIVKLKEAFRTKGIYYLVFDYLDNNLLELLDEAKIGLR